MFLTNLFGNRLRFWSTLFFVMLQFGWCLCIPMISVPSSFAMVGCQALLLCRAENFYHNPDNPSIFSGMHVGFYQFAAFVWSLGLLVYVISDSLFGRAPIVYTEFMALYNITPWIPIAGYDKAWNEIGVLVTLYLWCAAFFLAFIPFMMIAPQVVRLIMAHMKVPEAEPLVLEDGLGRSSVAAPFRRGSSGRRQSLFSPDGVKPGKTVATPPDLLCVYGSMFILLYIGYMLVNIFLRILIFDQTFLSKADQVADAGELPDDRIDFLGHTDKFNSGNILALGLLYSVISIAFILDASRRVNGFWFTPESSFLVSLFLRDSVLCTSLTLQSLPLRFFAAFVNILSIFFAFVAHFTMTVAEKEEE